MEHPRLRIAVRVRPRAGARARCSHCRRRAPGYDTQAVRRFDLVPLWHIPVVFLYAMRRVCCPRRGVRVEALPWATGKHRLTDAHAWFLAAWAKHLSWQEVAAAFPTSWDTVYRAVRMAVDCGLALVGHLSRDSTAIEAREKPAAKEKSPPPPKRKRGRPKKGEERPKTRKRLDRQPSMTLQEMLGDLPAECSVGTKKNSKGYRDTWVGYKLHIDVADGQIPVSCILTSASLHDSQVAIPLATMSPERTTNCYDLMDAAYDAVQIREYSRALGHVPLIDINPRRDKALAEELQTEARRLKRLGLQLPEQVRYNERTAGERVNGRLKDEFGGRHVRVRGNAKVMCHCMFGVLALTADQFLRLVT